MHPNRSTLSLVHSKTKKKFICLHYAEVEAHTVEEALDIFDHQETLWQNETLEYPEVEVFTVCLVPTGKKDAQWQAANAALNSRHKQNQ